MTIPPIKQGDVGVRIPGTLYNPDGSVANLTGATVAFHAIERRGRKTISETAAIDGDPVDGKVYYEMTALDTDIPGVYRYEFEADYPTGAKLTYPDGVPNLFQIYPQMG